MTYDHIDGGVCATLWPVFCRLDPCKPDALYRAGTLCFGGFVAHDRIVVEGREVRALGICVHLMVYADGSKPSSERTFPALEVDPATLELLRGTAGFRECA